MGVAQARLSEWLRTAVAPPLRDHGYRGSGQNFSRRFDAHWGVVNFQRSQWDSAERAAFTINLGVGSDTVRRETGEDLSKPPPEYGCQWRTRIGSLIGNRDVWWEVRDRSSAADLDAIRSELVPALIDLGLAKIEAMADDRAILASALENSTGWGGIETAGILLHHIGGTREQRARFDEMVSAARAFRRKHSEGLPRPAQGPKRTQANLTALAGTNPVKRAWAASQLGGSRVSDPVIKALRGALGDPDERVRVIAAASLLDLGDVTSFEAVLRLLRETKDRYGASEIARSAARLAREDVRVRVQVMHALRDRLACSVGFDLVGVGVALEELEELPWMGSSTTLSRRCHRDS